MGKGWIQTGRYWHPVVGYNYRMTNIAAAIGCAQLERVQQVLKRRKLLASWYQEALSRIHGLMQPVQKEYAEYVYWLYTVLFPKRSANVRVRIGNILQQYGIETRPLFDPMHLLQPYQENPARYPVATECAARGMNLPTHELLTEEGIAYVCEQLESAMQIAGLKA